MGARLSPASRLIVIQTVCDRRRVASDPFLICDNDPGLCDRTAAVEAPAEKQVDLVGISSGEFACFSEDKYRALRGYGQGRSAIHKRLE